MWAFLNTIAALVATSAFASPVQAASDDAHLPWDRAYNELARTPAADLAALRGHGAIAIRQGPNLYLADGATQTFRRVEHGGVVDQMAWSHDGRWFAYRTASEIWLVARDGATRRVPVVAEMFSWSPRADVLLTIHDAPWKRLPERTTTISYHEATGSLVTTDLRVVPAPLHAGPAAIRWSADGRTIVAYDTVAILPYRSWPHEQMALSEQAPGRGGGARKLALSKPGGQIGSVAIDLPGGGTLLWRGDEIGASIAADGQPVVYRAPSGS